MARLPYADTHSAPDSIRETLDRYPVAFLRVLAHAESAFDAWMVYSRALLGDLELDPVLREFAILQVARMRGSEYQWVQHVAIARAVGASAEQVAAIRDGEDEHKSLTEAQREVLRLVRELTLGDYPGEQLVDAVAARLGPRQLVELMLVAGHWTAICNIVGAFGLQLDLPAMAGALPETLTLRGAPPD
jgi:alkylhydroperoxidase family enzyme